MIELAVGSMRVRSIVMAGASLIAGLFAAGAALAQVTDHLGIPGPIELQGSSYVLAWTAQPAPNYVKQEYLPEGQSPQTYKQMLLVERVSGPIKVMDAVKVQVDTLTSRKVTDPLVNMDVIENKASGEALLDFIMSSKDQQGEIIVEWNAYRYSPGANGEGVLLFGVSHRAYGNDDAKEMLTSLKTTRAATIKALAGAPLPKPTK